MVVLAVILMGNAGVHLIVILYLVLLIGNLFQLLLIPVQLLFLHLILKLRGKSAMVLIYFMGLFVLRNQHLLALLFVLLGALILRSVKNGNVLLAIMIFVVCIRIMLFLVGVRLQVIVL